MGRSASGNGPQKVRGCWHSRLPLLRGAPPSEAPSHVFTWGHCTSVNGGVLGDGTSSGCHHPADTILFSPGISSSVPFSAVHGSASQAGVSRRNKTPPVLGQRLGSCWGTYGPWPPQGPGHTGGGQVWGSRCLGRNDSCAQASGTVKSLPG